MTLTQAFIAFALQQLGHVAPEAVTTRKLFGAMNVYAGARHIALLTRDRVFLRADDETRPQFEAAGMEPLRPFGDAEHAMAYYEVPADVLAHPDTLRPWVVHAVVAAERRLAPGDDGLARRGSQRPQGKKRRRKGKS